jgi:ammonia channel protein AmtB
MWPVSCSYGAFYGGKGHLLGAQCLQIALIFAWVGGLMGAFFYICKLAKILRVPVEVELAGLDISKHGGSAYDGGETGGKVGGGGCVCARGWPVWQYKRALPCG